MSERKIYWMGRLPDKVDFGDPYDGIMIDGATVLGPWGCMTPRSWARYGATSGKFGTGLGQKYEKQEDGRWLKTEG